MCREYVRCGYESMQSNQTLTVACCTQRIQTWTVQRIKYGRYTGIMSGGLR